MFSLKTWRQDFRASVVVFLVALPLCLGIALASGAPLASGLYAGIIGGVITGLFSGSTISVSGPAAGLTVIVASAILELKSFEVFTLAVFLSGLIQILFALIKSGEIGNYFPTSVIKGMLAAIGIILILKQLPHAVGYDADFMGDEAFFEKNGENTFSQIIVAFYRFHPGAIIISIISFVIIMFWEMMSLRGNKFFKNIPGALVAVIMSLILNKLFQQSLNLIVDGDHLVNLPFNGGLQEFFNNMFLPDWSQLNNPKVYTVALTLALVGSIESLLSIDAADKIDPEGHITNKNQELFAQGIGNALSGFVGGMPLTAVIVRTSANVSAGARSKLSAILHGLWLALCVILIPHVLRLIPLSVLATILVLVGYKLTKPALIKQMYHKGMNQFIPFIITILAILFTDLLTGIGIGMFVGFIFVIKSNVHQSVVHVQDGNMHLIRFHKDISFLQKAKLNKFFNQIPENSYVLIDGSYNVFIDDDILDAIEDFIKRAEYNGIKVELKKSKLAVCPMFKEV